MAPRAALISTASGLHQRELGGPDEVGGLFGQIGVEGYHVRFRQQCLQIHILAAVMDEDGIVDIGIAGQQPHPPRRQQVGDPPSDPPQPDDADGDAGIIVLQPPAEEGGDQGGVPPAAVLDMAVLFARPFEEGEHDRHGALGDGAPSCSRSANG